MYTIWKDNAYNVSKLPYLSLSNPCDLIYYLELVQFTCRVVRMTRSRIIG